MKLMRRSERVKLRNRGDGTLGFDGYAVRGMTKPDAVVTIDYK